MEQATQGDWISLELHQIPRAGWNADLVRTASQHRLRIPFLDQDTQCPF